VFRNRLYYSVKPLIPWSVRMAVRRWFALRQRVQYREVWPILPGSERPPVGWPGWPDRKQFALVLTHDIEGPAGVKKVKLLAELEMRFGFRSSFNFTPQGDYAVPAELRDWLVSRGFEVGVHDLKHDGKLYRSHARFKKHAMTINQYLANWGAVGFRSGFMLRNLDWHHDLNIQYDASTFDTDPFEPQPDGANTIFPFWIPNPNRNNTLFPTADLRPPSSDSPRPGYVELPYTLPQDSTLFFLLKQTDWNIWRKKLDWLAQYGGMALLNVHPDYLDFDGSKKQKTYPASYYSDFLKWVQTSYAGSFLNALPCEVASYYAKLHLSCLRNLPCSGALPDKGGL